MYAETSGVRLALGGIGGKHRISSRRDRFFYARAALRSEQAMEIEADEAFLVQEVMETIHITAACRGAPCSFRRRGAERTAVPYFNRRKSSNDRGRGNAGGILHCHR
ncbi:MAG: hypothetical protein ACLUIQ_07665 [Dialister invisus]